MFTIILIIYLVSLIGFFVFNAAGILHLQKNASITDLYSSEFIHDFTILSIILIVVTILSLTLEQVLLT